MTADWPSGLSPASPGLLLLSQCVGAGREHHARSLCISLHCLHSLQDPTWALRGSCPLTLWHREPTYLVSVEWGFEPRAVCWNMRPGFCSLLYPQLLLSWCWFLTASHGPQGGELS